MCSVVCNKRKNIKRERGVIRVRFVRKSAKLMAKSSSSIAHFILSLGLKSRRIGGKPENVYTNKRSLTVVVLVVVVATAEEEPVTFRAKDKLVALAAKKEDARQDIISSIR
jgi:hypothetical protein